VPTVLEADGFRFFFYSNEGTEPRHIHVEKGSGEAKFWLDPIELVAANGMKAKELRQARMLIEENADSFRRKWDEFFDS